MSMDQPNEAEQAIEEYAAAVRDERIRGRYLQVATEEHQAAVVMRREKWLRVSILLSNGVIKPGVYRINKGPGMYAEALLVQPHHDYPELLPMFR